MEEELVARFKSYLGKGDKLMEEERFVEAFESYLEALQVLGVFLVYKDTGMLVPSVKLPGFLGKYPEVEEVIRRYSPLTGGRDEATSLRRELERLKGMMSLPSSDG